MKLFNASVDFEKEVKTPSAGQKCFKCSGQNILNFDMQIIGIVVFSLRPLLHHRGDFSISLMKILGQCWNYFGHVLDSIPPINFSTNMMDTPRQSGYLWCWCRSTYSRLFRHGWRRHASRKQSSSGRDSYCRFPSRTERRMGSCAY